jgi:hypothetical protein
MSDPSLRLNGMSVRNYLSAILKLSANKPLAFLGRAIRPTEVLSTRSSRLKVLATGGEATRQVELPRRFDDWCYLSRPLLRTEQICLSRESLGLLYISRFIDDS